MRLTELDPKWLEVDGRKVGLIFLCPHCRTTRLSCFFEATPILNGGRWPSQVKLFERALGSEEAADQVVPCNKSNAWTRSGEDFASLSCSPSIDASSSGHWHGFITNGEIVG